MKCILRIKRHPELGIIAAPVSQHDADEFAKLNLNSDYRAVITKPRNPGHHSKAFALIQLIFENQDRYSNLEDLLTEIKLLSGWYDHHVRAPRPAPILDYLERMAGKLPAPFQSQLLRAAQKLRDEAGVVYIPKSIAFESMDQTAFEEFYKRLLEIAKDDFGVDAGEFA